MSKSWTYFLAKASFFFIGVLSVFSRKSFHFRKMAALAHTLHKKVQVSVFSSGCSASFPVKGVSRETFRQQSLPQARCLCRGCGARHFPDPLYRRILYPWAAPAARHSSFRHHGAGVSSRTASEKIQRKGRTGHLHRHGSHSMRHSHSHRMLFLCGAGKSAQPHRVCG